MKPRTIFAVSYGEYSDYGVHALFSRREDAETCVALFRGEARIEEFTLDSSFATDVRAGRKPFFVRLSRSTGAVTEIRVCDGVHGAFGGGEMGRDVHGDLYTSCWARDEKHAIKIASDRRARWIANGGKP